VSNHPFGGMDGMMLCAELSTRFSEVRIIVNDLLMNLRPLAPLFVPVNKHGRQNARYAQTLRDTLESNAQIATFPAGLCSRRHHGRVADPRWKHSFVKNALESRRDIVPVRFDGELSSFFYNLSNLRSALGIRANIEMLYLPDEMFRQKGRRFEIRFGEPVRWQSLRDAPAKVWAGRIRDMVYGLGSE
jgi:putative hemolysin